METLLSILHVVTAVFIIGPIAIIPMTALRFLRTGDTARSAATAKTVRILSYLSLIVVVTGFGVMGMADPRYHLSITTPWVLASLVLYAISLVLTLVVVVPALQGAQPRTGRSAYSRAAAGSGIATVCLLAVVVLMVWKP